MKDINECGDSKKMVEGLTNGKNYLVRLAVIQLKREGKCDKIYVGGKWVYGIDEYKMDLLFETMGKIVRRLLKKRKRNEFKRL